MATFLKFHGILNEYGHENKIYDDPKDRWINIEDIAEITDGGEREYTDENDVKQKVPVTHLYLLYSPPTWSVSPAGRSYSWLDHHVAYFEVDGTLDEVTARINKFRPGTCDCDEEEDSPKHTVNERGEWVSGKNYGVLDHVKKPGTTDGYLCVQDNTSSSSSVLSNQLYWCRFTLPSRG